MQEDKQQESSVTEPYNVSSASAILKAIATKHSGKLGITFSLVALENIMAVVYPLFAGYTVDAILRGDVGLASLYAVAILVFWLVGALRRSVDTRVFTHIYAHLAVKVAVEQRKQQHEHSVIAARVVLAREFVSFFEEHMPMLATTIITIIGSATMLVLIQRRVGMACFAILVLFAIIAPLFIRKNQELHEGLNDRLEREVELIEHAPQRTLMRHYISLSFSRIKLSDREAKAYLIIGAFTAALFLLAIFQLSGKQGVSAGHIYSVITYVWNFANSIDESPFLIDQFARLRDIGKRITADF